MSLEIRKSSSWWYGVFVVNGRKTVVNLKVPITGKRPPKRTMIGDDEFERSRGRAMEAYHRLRKKLGENRTTEKELRKIVELKTGKEVGFPKLSELTALWLRIPRRKTPGQQYINHCSRILERFVLFVQEAQPGIREFVEVKPETARAFLDGEHERGVSASTWNYSLELLRTTFKRLHPQLPHGNNPFHDLVTQAVETVSRVPFTPEELKAIQEACAGDDFIRPVIIAGMCTAMRRGDCCCLKWEDVDLGEGFISVKTSKTGQKVDIPIFPLLREELERAKAAGGKSGYCWPKAAEMYLHNADGITIRVKSILAHAFEVLATDRGERLVGPGSEEILTRALEYASGLENRGKADRMKVVLETYLGGQNIDEVVRQTGIPKGTASAYLNEVQKAIGLPVVRIPRLNGNRAGLQADRARGLRRASIRDFHSFRVTWITLALAAGVPLELVQRVTGHRTVEVVMKHYFRPGREDFRAAIMKAMPKMLAENPKQSLDNQIIGILDSMTDRNWRDGRTRIRALLGAR